MKDQYTNFKGYLDLTQNQIDLMVDIETKGSELIELISELQSYEGLDQRAFSIGKTEIQTGCMWLLRGVAQPE